jgi:SAM-dependent methyltransferase
MGAWLRFDAIRRGLSVAKPQRILEVGVGEGGLATWLARRADYVGVEIDAEARRVAHARLAGGPGRVVADVSAVTCDQFDLLCAFEVLEHIEDDTGALLGWSDLLTPDAWVLVSVPAHPSRFGAQDRLVGHLRRYEADALRRTLRAAGFEPVTVESYGAGLGFVLEAARNVMASRPVERSAEEATAHSGRHLQPHSRTGVGTRAVVSAVGRLVQHPFRGSDVGIGYVALGRRR